MEFLVYFALMVIGGAVLIGGWTIIEGYAEEAYRKRVQKLQRRD